MSNNYVDYQINNILQINRDNYLHLVSKTNILALVLRIKNFVIILSVSKELPEYLPFNIYLNLLIV